MATSAPPAPPAGAIDANHADLVHQQIERARRTVKLVELFSAGMTLLTLSMAYFLAAVLVDHWITPLSGWMRGLVLLAFLVGAGVFCWRRLLPLLLRPINPLYAARSMEQSAKTLKNSLLNFLFFRENRAGVQEAVFATLQQRAATDLSSPHVDTTVDLSRAMKVAYVLIGVLVVSAAYTILAPKSALQSLARVVNPWTSTAAPTRVSIDSLEPGDASVYYGEHVDVRVAVSGLRESDPVVLRYTTGDLQTVDEPIGMKRSEDGLYFVAKLPPGPDGVHQDLTYHVVAGDAESETYRVETNAAPSIIVDKVVYEFPEYTGISPRTEPRQGDIRGIEGARVTIHSHANRDIRSAAIEFDPEQPGAKTEVMKVDGRKAIATFVLQLNGQGDPLHKSYRLRFFDEQGKKNPNPIQHQIRVTPDYPPVVEILTPELRRIEVPLDSQEEIEVRAVDPDFALQRVRLRMVVGESEVFSEARERAQRGQAIERFAFSPTRLKLNVGDTVMYRAYAEDNRADLSGSPRPNVERTEEYSIVITAPKRKPGGSKNSNAAPDDQNPSDSSKQEQGAESQGREQDQDGGQSSEGDKPEGDTDGEGDGETGDKKPGGEGDPESGDDSGKGGGEGEKPGEKPGERSQTGENGGQGSQEGQGDNSGTPQGDAASGDSAGDPMNAEQGGQQGDPNGGQNQPGGGDPNAANQPGGEGGAGGQSQPGGENAPEGQGAGQGSPTSDQNPSGQARDGAGANGKGSPTDGNQQGGPATAGQGDPDLSQARPNDEPLTDGDAIDTIREHIERNQGQSTGESVRAEDQSDPSRARNATRNPNVGDSGQAGDPNQLPRDGDGNDPNRGGETQADPSRSGGSPNSQNPGGDAQGNDASQTGDNTAGDQPGQGSEGDKPEGANDTPRGQNANLGSGKQADGGTQGESGNPTNAQKRSANDETAESGMPTDGGQGDQGESGDGQKAESSQASPGATGQNQDRSKSGQPSGKTDDQGGSEPPPPTSTPKQSDSRGGESGDRSGGGKQGGGQSGKQQGNDSAGSQSAGDEGAGAAEQSGQGDTSAAGGNKQPAAKPTGVSGDREGEGSQTRPGEGGETGGEQSQSQNAKQRSRQVEGQDGGGQIGDGGGLPSRNPSQGGKAPIREVADGGEANVDFADKATELALDYLKHNPDDKALMDKLGWSDADRKRFIDRWSQLKKSAREGEAGRRRLNDALEGLGLRRGSESIRRQSAKSDAAGGLQQEGAGPANLPPHLLERFNAYKRGAAKSR